MYFAIGENTAHVYCQEEKIESVYRFLQKRFPYRKNGNLFPEPIHIRNDNHNNISPEIQKKLKFIDDVESGKFNGMAGEHASRVSKPGFLKEVDINDPNIKCANLVYDVKRGGYWLSIWECAEENHMSRTKVSTRGDLFHVWKVIEKYKYKDFIGTKNEIKAKFGLTDWNIKCGLDKGKIVLVEKVLEER